MQKNFISRELVRCEAERPRCSDATCAAAHRYGHPGDRSIRSQPDLATTGRRLSVLGEQTLFNDFFFLKL